MVKGKTGEINIQLYWQLIATKWYFIYVKICGIFVPLDRDNTKQMCHILSFATTI